MWGVRRYLPAVAAISRRVTSAAIPSPTPLLGGESATPSGCTATPSPAKQCRTGPRTESRRTTSGIGIREALLGTRERFDDGTRPFEHGEMWDDGRYGAAEAGFEAANGAVPLGRRARRERVGGGRGVRRASPPRDGGPRDVGRPPRPTPLSDERGRGAHPIRGGGPTLKECRGSDAPSEAQANRVGRKPTTTMPIHVHS